MSETKKYQPYPDGIVVTGVDNVLPMCKQGYEASRLKAYNQFNCISVINVTLPDEKQNYIHRIGRVGRAERYWTHFTYIGDCTLLSLSFSLSLTLSFSTYIFPTLYVTLSPSPSLSLFWGLFSISLSFTYFAWTFSIIYYILM